MERAIGLHKKNSKDKHAYATSQTASSATCIPQGMAEVPTGAIAHVRGTTLIMNFHGEVEITPRPDLRVSSRWLAGRGE